jgi:hypothetical protein
VPVADLLPHTWWNTEPLVTRLSLTAEQRKVMDEALRTHLEAERSDKGARAATAAFLSQVEDGHLKDARKEIQGMEEAAAREVRSAAEMKIAVAEALSSQQRITLLRARPRIFQVDWGQQANVHRLRSDRRPPPAAER